MRLFIHWIEHKVYNLSIWRLTFFSIGQFSYIDSYLPSLSIFFLELLLIIRCQRVQIDFLILISKLLLFLYYSVAFHYSPPLDTLSPSVQVSPSSLFVTSVLAVQSFKYLLISLKMKIMICFLVFWRVISEEKRGQKGLCFAIVKPFRCVI